MTLTIESQNVEFQNAETSQGVGNAAQEKDPFTRLLDLTLGWAEYIEGDEADTADTVKAAEVYAAHQSIAEFAEPYWDAAPEVQEMAVRHFVDTRLLPLLLGKTKV